MQDFEAKANEQAFTLSENEARARLAQHDLITMMNGDPKSICHLASLVVPGTPSLSAVAYWRRHFFIAKRIGIAMSVIGPMLLPLCLRIIGLGMHFDRNPFQEIGLLIGMPLLNRFCMLLP